MTKKLFFSLILTFTLLIISNVESNGQCTDCPAGWFNYSFVYKSSRYDCDITVHYCTNCAPHGFTEIKICNLIIPTDTCSITLNPLFWENLKKAVVVQSLSECNMLGIVPPCSTFSRTQVIVTSADCFRAEFDDIAEVANILPCEEDEGECVQEFSVCFNGTDYILTFTPGTPDGDCENVTPTIDVLDKYEECFHTCY
jgi:hypothetical protein